ncbi:hypothetical protein C8R45DRAFT_1165374 [Mycena sanguinolenta]|nr:hypothetical protein C8R45DRAFT_1165374 [Mycena sanguinolenta]
MSEPPLRRNPLRSSRIPPRHPDSPVSFAVPQAPSTVLDDDANSDSSSRTSSEFGDNLHHDLTEDLETGIIAEGLQRRSDALESLANPAQSITPNGLGPTRSPSPDVFGGGTGTGGVAPSMRDIRSMLQHLQESLAQDEQEERNHNIVPIDSDDEPVLSNQPTILSVDTGRGTLQERADRLIQEIRQLHPPSPPSLRASPAPTEIRSPSRTHAVPISATVIGPQGAGKISVTGLQGSSRPSLYFVGVQTPAFARSFCQIRSFMDLHFNDGAIFRRLQLAGGPVGRALSSIMDRQTYFVGTSDYPIDIGNDHTNHRHNFREIGSLFEVELHDGANVQFLPIPNSPARSALIQSQRGPADIDVYVLYVYYADADPLVLFADGSAAPQSIVTSAPLALTPVRSHPAPCLTLQQPLTPSQHTCTIGSLPSFRSLPLGVPAPSLLGIGLLGRNHTPAMVGSMTIRLEDVVAAAGINHQTFSTYRTELRLIKEAHIVLRRLHRAGQLPQAQKPLLDCLEVMLSERTLSADAARPLPGSEPSAEAEFSAVRMTISTLMTQVRQVIDTFGHA